MVEDGAVNGNRTVILDSYIKTRPVILDSQDAQLTTITPPLSCIHPPKQLHSLFHVAVARHSSHVRRRVGISSIMRTALGALGMASVCLFWLTYSSPIAQVPSRRAMSLTVQLVTNHKPLVPRPWDNETTKYFHEPVGHEPDDDELLGHYDIRYFTGQKVSYEERTDTLHHMIRAYLSSLRELGVETWISHGTLLGWWWNGQVLPWDWDLDVQVTGKTLQYMGKWLNGTVHSYKSGSVERQYLLDVNPYAVERVNGDGMNIIDARWIDMRNGLFIDITGISELDPQERPGIWSCKNYHDYYQKDIWPLKETWFEGVPVMVPSAYAGVLADEYGKEAFERTEYEGHHWDVRIEKWVADKTVPRLSNQKLAQEPSGSVSESPDLEKVRG